MSSTKLYISDIKKRILFSRFVMNKNLYKYLTNDLALPFGLKKYVFFRLALFYKNICIARQQNRCIYTYRSRSVYRKFKMARSQLREAIWKLILPGMYLASW